MALVITYLVLGLLWNLLGKVQALNGKKNWNEIVQLWSHLPGRHVADSVSIPDTPCGPLSITRSDPWGNASIKFWAQSGTAHQHALRMILAALLFVLSTKFPVSQVCVSIAVEVCPWQAPKLKWWTSIVAIAQPIGNKCVRTTMTPQEHHN